MLLCRGNITFMFTRGSALALTSNNGINIMKLFLTLEDDDGQKVERVLEAQQYFGDQISELVENMVDSLAQSKKPL